MSDVPTLYHFTCKDGARMIGRYNCLIIPQGPHPICRWNISWFTTEAAPDPEATGLSTVRSTCDRTAHRYIVSDPGPCVPWEGSRWQAETPPPFRQVMEEYGDVEHWWVSDVPVRVIWDRAYSEASRV